MTEPAIIAKIHTVRNVATILFRCIGWSSVAALLVVLMWADPVKTSFGNLLTFIQQGIFYQIVIVFTLVLVSLRVIFFCMPAIDTLETGCNPNSTQQRGRMDDQPLEPRIAPLVHAMNETGVFTTIASCEGHRWKRMGPYIYFRAPVAAAAMLTRLIDADYFQDAGALHYEWRIDAQFNFNYELCFSLRSPRLDLMGWWNTVRLECDLATLASMITELIHLREQYKPGIGHCGCNEQCRYPIAEEYEQPETSGMGVGCIALTTLSCQNADGFTTCPTLSQRHDDFLDNTKPHQSISQTNTITT